MNKLCRTMLCMSPAFGFGLGTPAVAQTNTAEEAGTISEIIVTARRVEERLQDVPISITVFNQEQLTNNNVQSAKDLAIYTPALATNNRYGADNTTWTIRGFTQEQRTFSTVGTFFADVVMPRGSGATQGGDGAGPGALFDLQNVQVLKGPQGTLFGRNVTGGAVLLVPQRPTDTFEGYVEASGGDYGMWRGQGVLNVPIAESVRVRVGVDSMQRDGYLKNIGRFGDGRNGDNGMGDVDYWTARASVVADLTPNLENYTVAYYSRSKTNPVIPKITKFYLNGVPFGAAAQAQVQRESAEDFWTVSNRIPGAVSITETWQVINTTTWNAADSLTVKNILSYGEFRGVTNLELFGNYFIGTGVTPGQETPGQVSGFAFTSAEPVNGHSNAQSSWVEELQFQGHPGDGRFVWQAGGYVEVSDPLGFSGVQTASFNACADILSFNCTSNTTGSFSLSKTKFRDYAVYSQASYNLTDQFKLTAGVRYTWDEVRTLLHNETMLFGTPANASTVRFRCTNLSAPGYSGLTTYPFTVDQRFDVCGQNLRKDTEAPTWVLGLDYKPIDDLMLYAKWSRGYRQGGLAIFGPDPIQPFDAEEVDTYEIGAKTGWRGAVPGNFSVSTFYNDFRNQQLQFGIACASNLPGFTISCAGNAAVLNAGESRLYGLEAELSLAPFEGLRLDASYAYLNSELKSIEVPAPGSLPPYNSFTPPVAGDVIANAGPPHKFVAAPSYTLPLPDTIGKLSIGATYVYQDKYRAVTDGVTGSGNGILPKAEIVNLNVNWEGIGGGPIDASLFVTNLTNEHIYLHANDNQLRGFVSYFIGEPRMWGGRVRYRFGN